MDNSLSFEGAGFDLFPTTSITANNEVFHQPQTYPELTEVIDRLGAVRKYAPLTANLRQVFHAWYYAMLNGFDRKPHRQATIKGTLICRDYNRVVVGDYGAYLEFTPEQLLVTLDIPSDQRWRLDKPFVASRNISLKYEWYEFLGEKVYFQCSTVNYADYKVGHYYISVLAFDIE